MAGNECNNRIHGTTRKVPFKQFTEKEQKALLPLPLKEYEIFEIEERIVDNYGHVTYRYNFYSVPHTYIGKKVIIKSNSKILKVYDERYNEIAVHALSNGTGEFITNKSHNPRLKSVDYENKALSIGTNVYAFYNNLKENKPHQYHRIIMGVFELAKKYGNAVVDLSCKRANEFNSMSYSSVKRICENRLYIEKDISSDESVRCGGYCNDLSQYDLIDDK